MSDFASEIRQEVAARRPGDAADVSDAALASRWQTEVEQALGETLRRLADAGRPGSRQLPVAKNGFGFRRPQLVGWNFGNYFLTDSGELRHRLPDGRGVSSEPLPLWQVFRHGQENAADESVYYQPERVHVLSSAAVRTRLVRLLVDVGIDA